MIWIKKVAVTPLDAVAKVIDSLVSQTNDRTNAPSIHAVRTAYNSLDNVISQTKTELDGDIEDVKDDLSDTNDSLSTLSDTVTALQSALNNYWKTIYPVGAIYVSMNDTSPATLFGGTWEKIQNRFLYCSTTSGTTGGAAAVNYTPSGGVAGHALTVPELPEHIHPYRYYYPDDYEYASHYSVAAGSNRIDKVVISPAYAELMYTQYNSLFVPSTDSIDHTQHAEGAAHTHGFTGQQAQISTMPPYLTVHAWKRTA